MWSLIESAVKLQIASAWVSQPVKTRMKKADHGFIPTLHDPMDETRSSQSPIPLKESTPGGHPPPEASPAQLNLAQADDVLLPDLSILTPEVPAL